MTKKKQRSDKEYRVKDIPDFLNDEVRQVSATLASQLLPPEIAKLRQKYKLNLNQYRFIAVYCYLGFTNQGKAYQWAGYSASNSASYNGANRLLAMPEIQEVMKAYTEYIMGPYASKIRVNLMETYYRQAFYDPAMFIDPHKMTAKALKDIPREWRVCIDGVERKYHGFGDDKETITKYTLADRHKALDKLAQYIAWAKDTGQGEVSEELVNIVNKIFGARGESNSAALKLLDQA